MKNILIPTDFSSTAKNAFRFAQSFLSYDVNIKLLNVYRPEIDPSYAYLGTPSEVFLKQQEARFIELGKSIQQEEGNILSATKIQYEVRVGFPTDVIVKASKENIDLIVMGGTGETNAWDRMIGSVASQVAQRAHCPVLLVPSDAYFSGFRHSLYASDYTSVQDELIQKAVTFTNPFKSIMHFIHIHPETETPALDKVLEDRLFKILFGDAMPRLEFNMASINTNDIAKGLKRYIQENEIDLAILVTQHRSFIKRLLHKSITKAMAFNLNIPILVFHDKIN